MLEHMFEHVPHVGHYVCPSATLSSLRFSGRPEAMGARR
jgi:hypothetical protein